MWLAKLLIFIYCTENISQWLWQELAQFNFKKGSYFFFAENFYKVAGDRCKCAIPCEIISFKPVLSYASFPSDIFLKAMIKKNLNNATDKEIEDYISLAR